MVKEVPHMARKVVKVNSTGHSKIGMLMTALAAVGAVDVLKNRKRRAGLLGGIGKLGAAAATFVAAREVLTPQSFARAIGRPSRSRFSAWLAR